MTSPKASGSASIHEWVPGTVTMSGLPSALAHVLERVARDELIALSPEDHDGQAAPTQRVELLHQVGPAGDGRRAPERSRISHQVPDDLGDDDGQDPVHLAGGEQVGREMDAPVPQRPLRHGADGRPGMGPSRTADRVDQHERAHLVRVIVRQRDGDTAAERVPHDEHGVPDSHRLEEGGHPVPVGRQRGGLTPEAARPAEARQGGGVDVQPGAHQAGERAL